MGKWLGNVEKYCRNHIPFLVWGILSIGEQHRPKPTKGAHFRDFVYIYLSRPSIRKVCSVHFLELQKFVVSAFWEYKILWCLLFGTTKVWSVCFFRLQNFMMSAFWDYKILWCPLFGTTKVCSIRFLGVQKFVVSSPLRLQNFVVRFSDI